MRSLFDNFFSNIKKIFFGYNLLWHALAIVSTYFLVVSGFDWFYASQFRTSIAREFILPALLLGGLLPIVIPLGLLVSGAFQKNRKQLNLGFAIGQAAILGSLISSFYKALTGRVPPRLFDAASSLTDISHKFQFGFLRGGIFWGWPSSHTTIAFAMAVTVCMLYPKNKLVVALSLLYALYIGLSVSISIHWFSEFTAGAIIGSVIGTVVGRSFRKRREKIS
jgi:membrane-associated phospholipid phosphatase